jgi:carboxymethylenebutenolidase
MARYMTGMLIGSVERAGISDLKAALTHLAAMPDVEPRRIGAIGFCMGGGFAIAWACTDDRLKAIAVLYAANPRPIDLVKRACPIVGSYPEKDFTAGAGRALDQALDKYEIDHDIKIYPGANHSFFNAHGRVYNQAAAKDSWDRVMAFFGKHLMTGS